MDFYESDHWYFGDYRGGLPGKNYSALLYVVIVLLLVQIALLQSRPSVKSVTIWLDFALNIIEIFFIGDYIGKLINTWSKSEYSPGYILPIFFSRPAVADLVV